MNKIQPAGQFIPMEAATDKDPDKRFREELLTLIPHLRAFARVLCRDRSFADDLTQEALAKAWQARATFTVGTNLKAWLFTILRNQFYSHHRRAWRESPLAEDAAEYRLTTEGDQWSSMMLSDVARAMRDLPDEQREALILVAAGGFSYEDAAAIGNCAVGTIKSRVSRARKSVTEALDGKGPPLNGPRMAGSEVAGDIMAEIDRASANQAADNAGQPNPGQRKRVGS